MNSPYKCKKCGKPANSPLYREYCWSCYDKYTDGKQFDPRPPEVTPDEA
jgi:hypothetical protein